MASQAGRLIEPLYDISAEAQNDLFEIWQRIAEDSVELANRIEDEFHDLFASLGRMPGHSRRELTSRPVLFSRCTHS
jgi:plasmid stabilization system protein ParE